MIIILKNTNIFWLTIMLLTTEYIYVLLFSITTALQPPCRFMLVPPPPPCYVCYQRYVCRGQGRTGPGGRGGVPPQAPCLIKFIRIDIDLYIR